MAKWSITLATRYHLSFNQTGAMRCHSDAHHGQPTDVYAMPAAHCCYNGFNGMAKWWAHSARRCEYHKQARMEWSGPFAQFSGNRVACGCDAQQQIVILRRPSHSAPYTFSHRTHKYLLALRLLLMDQIRSEIMTAMRKQANVGSNVISTVSPGHEGFFI